MSFLFTLKLLNEMARIYPKTDVAAVTQCFRYCNSYEDCVECPNRLSVENCRLHDRGVYLDNDIILECLNRFRLRENINQFSFNFKNRSYEKRF